MVRDFSAEFSVVVPIHGMSGKLGEMFKWIKTIDEMKLNAKVLIVEDGADTSTLAELEAVRRFDFVKIYSGRFSSPGLARNYGLDRVATRWVTFWDADDSPQPISIQETIESVGPKTNIIIGSYKAMSTTTGKCTKASQSTNLKSMAWNPGIWRFVFKTERIGETRFISSRMGEDQVFLSQLNIAEQECQYSKKVFYIYNSGNPGQLTGSKLAIQEIGTSVIELIEVFKKQNYRVQGYALIIFSKMLYTAWRHKSLGFLKLIANYRGPWSPLLKLTARLFLTVSVEICRQALRKIKKK